VRVDGDEAGQKELQQRIAAIEHKTRFSNRRSRERRIQARRDHVTTVAWSFAASAAVAVGIGLGVLFDRGGF